MSLDTIRRDELIDLKLEIVYESNRLVLLVDRNKNQILFGRTGTDPNTVDIKHEFYVPGDSFAIAYAMVLGLTFDDVCYFMTAQQIKAYRQDTTAQMVDKHSKTVSDDHRDAFVELMRLIL